MGPRAPLWKPGVHASSVGLGEEESCSVCELPNSSWRPRELIQSKTQRHCSGESGGLLWSVMPTHRSSRVGLSPGSSVAEPFAGHLQTSSFSEGSRFFCYLDSHVTQKPPASDDVCWGFLAYQLLLPGILLLPTVLRNSHVRLVKLQGILSLPTCLGILLGYQLCVASQESLSVKK